MRTPFAANLILTWMIWLPLASSAAAGSEAYEDSAFAELVRASVEEHVTLNPDYVVRADPSLQATALELVGQAEAKKTLQLTGKFKITTIDGQRQHWVEVTVGEKTGWVNRGALLNRQPRPSEKSVTPPKAKVVKSAEPQKAVLPTRKTELPKPAEPEKLDTSVKKAAMEPPPPEEPVHPKREPAPATKPATKALEVAKLLSSARNAAVCSRLRRVQEEQTFSPSFSLGLQSIRHMGWDFWNGLCARQLRHDGRHYSQFFAAMAGVPSRIALPFEVCIDPGSSRSYFTISGKRHEFDDREGSQLTLQDEHGTSVFKREAQAEQ